MKYCMVILLLLVVGCGGKDIRNGHEPGQIETLENAKVYHLKDGMFIHETYNGESYYWLIDDSVASYELIPKGLRLQPKTEDGVITCLRGDGSSRKGDEVIRASWYGPGPGGGVSRNCGSNADIIEEIISNFRAYTTFEEIVQMTVLPDGYVFRRSEFYWEDDKRLIEAKKKKILEKTGSSNGTSVQAQETEKEAVAALVKYESRRGIIRYHEDGTVRLFHLESSLTITAADLSHLTALTNLTEVTVTGPRITDAFLVHLSGLKKLEQLILSDAKITDAGLEHLKRLTTLKVLSLWGTQVTDAGLDHLKGLTNLSYLSFYDTQVTDAGVAELKKALPGCRISR